MAGAQLEQLRDLVLADPALQARLLATHERARFVAAVVDVAADHGLDVTASYVETELVGARRRWQERWV